MLVWAVAAIMAGTVTSWAVTVIGGESSGASSTVLSEADVRAALATQTALPVPTISPSATATPTAAPTAPDPTPLPSAAPTHASAATPPPAAPAQPPAPAQPAQPAPTVVRTWDVTGGRISASCTGASFSLLYATPTDGWSIHVKPEGSTGAEVVFTSGEKESKAYLTCVAGVPTRSSSDSTPGDD
ncbi:hypothetical protein GALL_386250 [mine drainage metagenome]|uniref:Uncharacterized protein n=1 Tax=mine drainage metagenome TaxID=410659 RepID=A0A1J5QUS6_9ZZZZ